VDLPSSVILLTRSEWTIFYLLILLALTSSTTPCAQISDDPTWCHLELIAYLTDTQTELVHSSPLSCRGAAATAATRYHLCLIFSTKCYFNYCYFCYYCYYCYFSDSYNLFRPDATLLLYWTGHITAMMSYYGMSVLLFDLLAHVPCHIMSLSIFCILCGYYIHVNSGYRVMKQTQ